MLAKPIKFIKDTISDNDYRIFTISKTELFVFILLSTIITFASVITNQILNGRFIDEYSSLSISETVNNKLFLISENELTAKLGNFIQWFLLGSFLYILIWVLVVFCVDGYNNVLISNSFVHPKSFHHSDYWLVYISRFIVRVAAFFLLIFLALSSYYLLPYWFELSSNITLKIDYLSKLSIVIISTTSYFYFLTVLTRLVFLKRRVY